MESGQAGKSIAQPLGAVFIVECQGLSDQVAHPRFIFAGQPGRIRPDLLIQCLRGREQQSRKVRGTAEVAPDRLDPRRTILLLAQPLGRGDLALGIFSAVCGLALCAQAFLTLLVFLGLRALGLLVPLQFLLLPLPLIFSFAALYAVVLLATYAVRSGPFAMAVALGSLLAVLFLGNSHGARAGAPLGVQSVLATLVPRIVPLSQQAMHAGASERMSLSPFVLTAAFTAALLIGLQFLARRSER